MMIKLNVSIKVPNEAPREFSLSFDKSSVTIGRDRENEVQIPLGTVSRRHARLYVEGPDWFVEDLGSTHGTKLNGESLNHNEQHLLHDGDVVEIVFAKISFSVVDENELSGSDHPEEQTSVVAQRMVKEAVHDLDESSEIPHVVVMNGELQGKSVKLGPQTSELVIGRGDTCEVKLESASVSRKHAQITRERNVFFVEDLSSKNGVTLNGKKIEQKTEVHDSDEIGVGSIKIVFVDPQAHILGRLEQLPAFSKAKEDEDPKPKETPGEKTGTATQGTKSFSQSKGSLTDSTFSKAPAKKFGTVEYTIVALLGLVVVGLIVGVVIALT